MVFEGIFWDHRAKRSSIESKKEWAKYGTLGYTTGKSRDCIQSLKHTHVPLQNCFPLAVASPAPKVGDPNYFLVFFLYWWAVKGYKIHTWEWWDPPPPPLYIPFNGFTQISEGVWTEMGGLDPPTIPPAVHGDVTATYMLNYICLI